MAVHDHEITKQNFFLSYKKRYRDLKTHVIKLSRRNPSKNELWWNELLLLSFESVDEILRCLNHYSETVADFI